MDGGSKILEDVAALLTAGLDHSQHRFHETAAAGTLRAEGKLTPDDGATQCAFAWQHLGQGWRAQIGPV